MKTSECLFVAAKPVQTETKYIIEFSLSPKHVFRIAELFHEHWCDAPTSILDWQADWFSSLTSHSVQGSNKLTHKLQNTHDDTLGQDLLSTIGQCVQVVQVFGLFNKTTDGGKA